MLKLPKITLPYTSLRINLTVVCEMVLLHLVLLAVMYHFSRQALREEAMQNAEQTLEGTVQHIDNILLSVEQTTGNIYCELIKHLDQPERMSVYCRELLESNPYIGGCAIAFTPYYYKDRELFMTYVHRKGGMMKADEKKELITSDTFGSKPYTEQVWYTQGMESGYAFWTDPLPPEEDEGTTLTFCLPIYDNFKLHHRERQEKPEIIGVMAVDLPISLLSHIVMEAKPSPNSYSILLGRNGSYIVHPIAEKLANQTVFTQTQNDESPSMHDAAEAMMAGETGYKSFQQDGQDWYVFYKPFLRAKVEGRSTEDLSWSVGVVYPEEDIFGAYNILFYLVLAISIAGLLLFYILCRWVFRQQMSPLRLLTRAVQRIADGHYDETIPNTQREDEIGQLQTNFQKMQQSLLTQGNTLTQLTTSLQQHNEVLQKADGQAQEAKRMKTSFMHYMTDQMTLPADTIDESVAKLCNNYQSLSKEEIDHLVETIEKQSDTIVDLLGKMLNVANNEAGKEDAHE